MPLISDLGRYELGIIDHTNEDATFSIFIPKVDAANLDATVFAVGQFASRVRSIIVGNMYRDILIAQDVFGEFLPADDPTAQRELEWLVLYQDAITFKDYTFRIPTPDVANTDLRKLNSDFADLTDDDWQDLIEKFEAIAVAPDTGNPVVFKNALLVGKNDRN